MSNIVIGLLAVLNVYFVTIVVSFKVMQKVRIIISKNDSNLASTYIATVRTLHILLLILLIYLFPLIALVICLALNSIMVGPIILLIFGTTGFVTNRIIIPISEDKHIELAEKYYGKDSAYTKYLIEKRNNNKKRSIWNWVSFYIIIDEVYDFIDVFKEVKWCKYYLQQQIQPK